MLINATVSHELRNPLNSLIAQNIEKRALHKELQLQIQKSNLDEPIRDKMNEISLEITTLHQNK